MYQPLGGVLSLRFFLFVCVSVQFQSGGDPKTGAVVSAQEAQAQAILQQTKVQKHLERSLHSEHDVKYKDANVVTVALPT